MTLIAKIDPAIGYVETDWTPIPERQLPNTIIPAHQLPPKFDADGNMVPGETVPEQIIPGEIIPAQPLPDGWIEAQLVPARPYPWQTWNGTAWVGDKPAPDLAAYAANARWRKEIGGIVVGGVPIATDDRSKTMILGARIRAQDDPDLITPWSADDGQVYELTSSQVIAISEAVGAHVSACFAAYSSALAKINAGIITTTADVDLEFA